MTAFYTAMPLWLVMSSFVAAVLILTLGEPYRRTRVFINLAAAIVKLLLVGTLLWGLAKGHSFILQIELLPGIDFILHADSLTMMLSVLSAILWLVTTVYAIGYLEDSPNRARFFGFFSLCVAATMGVAVAGNLFTFFIFYELLTLSTWPLVVHRGTAIARRAGAVYLAYTLGGGAVLLIGIVAVQILAGHTRFTPGGFMGIDGASTPVLVLVFMLLFTGMAVKAAMVPLHGWLPRAMVAPAPVSALLHAVAVVKAGAFGIIRLVHDVFGIELTAALALDHVVSAIAAFTIIYGSLLALRQDDLKARLAYSTISQVSYIALGVGIGGSLGYIGGLAHLVHQGLMKITLFFCAGNLAETHGIRTVSEMDGIGRRMPLTMSAFTIAALGMIGVPPIAGFLSKWFLGLGSVQAGEQWVISVLVGSTLLNAAYFLPILRRAWFSIPAGGRTNQRTEEAPPSLLWPTLVSGALALGAGFLGGMPYSPLDWATFIAAEVYP